MTLEGRKKWFEKSGSKKVGKKTYAKIWPFRVPKWWGNVTFLVRLNEKQFFDFLKQTNKKGKLLQSQIKKKTLTIFSKTIFLSWEYDGMMVWLYKTLIKLMFTIPKTKSCSIWKSKRCFTTHFVINLQQTINFRKFIIINVCYARLCDSLALYLPLHFFTREFIVSFSTKYYI